MDLLSQGVSMLDAARKASMSGSVTYDRGGDTTTIAATVGTYQYEVATEAGVMVAAHVVDFIVSAADLVIGDAVVTPMIGDRITVTATGKSYEVLDIAPGECWRWSGPPGTARRIHTKEVS